MLFVLFSPLIGVVEQAVRSPSTCRIVSDPAPSAARGYLSYPNKR